MNKDRVILIAGLIAALFVATAIFGMKPKQVSAPVAGNNQQAPPANDLGQVSGFKTYTNSQYGFSVEHPSDFSVGTNSKNSVLGTYEEPVSGIHVGGLVFIPLTNDLLKNRAQDYINAYIEVAKNPLPAQEGPTIECHYDNELNKSVAVDYVYCAGEGGPATYALIKGNNLSIFMDGYSGGFGGDVGPGRMDQNVIKLIVSSFRFNQ